MLPWPKLPDDLKHSNMQQVVFMEMILNKAGYGIRKAEKPVIINFKLKNFSKDVELMARMEHARWNIERLNSGWIYGPVKDEDKKISPYLVGWNALSDEIRGYDVEAVQNYPDLLAKAGFEIFKIKPERK